ICGHNGKGIVAYDMVDAPHLAIAGETGAGKSSQMRCILTSLIKYLPPDKLHLYLGDLKRAEFHLFRKAPHVKGLAVEIPDLEQLLLQVNEIVDERSRWLDEHEVTHVEELPFEVPYVIVGIDEVALLKR